MRTRIGRSLKNNCRIYHCRDIEAGRVAAYFVNFVNFVNNGYIYFEKGYLCTGSLFRFEVTVV